MTRGTAVGYHEPARSLVTEYKLGKHPDTLTLRYDNLSRNDHLAPQLFAPKWPKGTRKEKAAGTRT